MKFETAMFFLFCAFTILLILVAALGAVLCFKVMVWPTMKYLIGI